MAFIYTDEQLRAINADGRDLLVSAAAGSGKTAVLTERILRIISGPDPDDPSVFADLGRLLVVTFTESATNEMRAKISAKIGEAAERAADPALRAHLLRQSVRLPFARISTIHAFCSRLVRENFQTAGVDPSFRVADETEAGLLKAQVMDALFEEEYEREENDGFLDLTDAFGGKTKDDWLDTLVRRLHKFLSDSPDPTASALEYARFYDLGGRSAITTPWAGIVSSELADDLRAVMDCIKRADAVCRLPGGPAAYAEALRDDARFAGLLLNVLDEPFEATRAAFEAICESHSYARFAPRKKDDGISDELAERVRRLRDKGVKARMKKIRAEYFFAPPEKMRRDMLASGARVAELLRLALRFGECYSAEKRARNLLDFNDLEHFAIEVLAQKESAPAGGAAEAFRERLIEALIDEYQDSNAVQETILSRVSKRRFMVGDVKQSIYRFRRAQPELFIEKYKSFAREEGNAQDGLLIDLSVNFRSRSEIIDSVNFFFSQLMSGEVGEVDYDENAVMKAGAAYPDDTGRPPRVFVDVAAIEAGNYSRPDPDSDEFADDDEADPTQIEREARMIADRIKNLVGSRTVWDSRQKISRPCAPGDIAILTRGGAGVINPLSEALKNLGIDAFAEQKVSFYEAAEVRTAMAFLRVIDNPRQDVDLLAVLCSGVYALTPDELLLIRGASDEPDFYACLAAFDKAGPGGGTIGEGAARKARRFLSDLKNWRARASWMTTSGLLNSVYFDTRYPALCGALPGGRLKKANLRLLAERAVEYEETSLRGLYHFVRFVELQSALGDTQLQAAPSLEDEAGPGRVRLMTIHKSKGLEFPVVIVSMLGRQFNREDERGAVLFHRRLGLGPENLNIETRLLSNTLPRLAISKLARRESLSEELRVLYVAMTRAKEYLILTGSVKGVGKKMMDWSTAAYCEDVLLDASYRRGCGSFLDFLMPCLARHRDGESAFESECGLLPHKNPGLRDHPARFELNIYRDAFQNSAKRACAPEARSDEKNVPALSLDSIMEGRSEYKHELGVPSKISITELKRKHSADFFDEQAMPYENAAGAYEPPAFISGARGLTPALIGAALHTLTEHIDLEAHRTAEAVAELIKTLAKKNLLDDAEAESIDINKALAFVNSPLAERMRKSSRVVREAPFVLALDSAGLSQGAGPGGENSFKYMALDPDAGGGAKKRGDTVLMHGIIDCYFEEGDGLVLVDYKSGAVGSDPQVFAERHRTQLELYKATLEQSTGKKVSETLIYSFASGAAARLA